MPFLPLPILLPPLLPLQLICGALGGWILREKGRPIWAGAVLGLLLGLAGLAIAAVLPRAATDGRRSAPV
jgi:hypothetical protein